MHPVKKALAFVLSSFVIVVVGLAVVNRLSARVPFIKKIMGVA